MRARPLIIAVDGPAASGKGTIARALAAHYGLPHLDTGLLYRAVGLGVARAGADVADAEAAARVAAALPDALPEDPELRSERASGLASIVSAQPQVRALLMDRQRAFAARPGGAVIDGRDIGTVIVPDATVKLFVTASARERARRRWRELGGDYAAILAAIEARDARDAGRTTAPLRQAEDAALLDTSNLGIEDAIRRALSLVEARIARG